MPTSAVLSVHTLEFLWFVWFRKQRQNLTLDGCQYGTYTYLDSPGSSGWALTENFVNNLLPLFLTLRHKHLPHWANIQSLGNQITFLFLNLLESCADHHQKRCRVKHRKAILIPLISPSIPWSWNWNTRISFTKTHRNTSAFRDDPHNFILKFRASCQDCLETAHPRQSCRNVGKASLTLSHPINETLGVSSICSCRLPAPLWPCCCIPVSQGCLGMGGGMASTSSCSAPLGALEGDELCWCVQHFLWCSRLFPQG